MSFCNCISADCRISKAQSCAIAVQYLCNAFVESVVHVWILYEAFPCYLLVTKDPTVRVFAMNCSLNSAMASQASDGGLKSSLLTCICPHSVDSNSNIRNNHIDNQLFSLPINSSPEWNHQLDNCMEFEALYL